MGKGRWVAPVILHVFGIHGRSHSAHILERNSKFKEKKVFRTLSLLSSTDVSNKLVGSYNIEIVIECEFGIIFSSYWTSLNLTLFNIFFFLFSL